MQAEHKAINPFEANQKIAPIVHVRDTTKHPLEDLPDSELIKRYKPKFIGMGGENLVYGIEKSPDIVIKAEMRAITDTVNWNLKHGRKASEDSEGVEALRKSRLQEVRAAYRHVRHIYGKHVLPQKQFVMKVPVNIDILTEAATANNKVFLEEDTQEAWTIVTVQRKSRAFEDGQALPMGGGNLEYVMSRKRGFAIPEDKWELYEYATEGLMNKSRALEVSLDEQHLYKLFENTPLKSLLMKALYDPALADQLADFQKKAVEFSQEYEDILDIAGKDNILFHRDIDGAWTYTLVDSIYPFEKKVLSLAREYIARSALGVSLGLRETSIIFQAVNFVRVMNALGKILDTGAYINFADDDTFGKQNISKILTGHA